MHPFPKNLGEGWEGLCICAQFDEFDLGVPEHRPEAKGASKFFLQVWQSAAQKKGL